MERLDERHKQIAEHRMKPTSILIVEDEFILASDLALRLRDMGYAVVGVAAALEIRQRRRLPVVFLAAYADDDTLQHANSRNRSAISSSRLKTASCTP